MMNKNTIKNLNNNKRKNVIRILSFFGRHDCKIHAAFKLDALISRFLKIIPKVLAKKKFTTFLEHSIQEPVVFNFLDYKVSVSLIRYYDRQYLE